MRNLFEDDGVEAMLLVDASNAFNSLNREAALRNIRIHCPVPAPMLTNMYRTHSMLFIDGDPILSQEGTTQGGPLAMAMYAIGTLPLIHKLQGEVTQAWYAYCNAALSVPLLWRIREVLRCAARPPKGRSDPRITFSVYTNHNYLFTLLQHRLFIRTETHRE